MKPNKRKYWKWNNKLFVMYWNINVTFQFLRMFWDWNLGIFLKLSSNFSAGVDKQFWQFKCHQISVYIHMPAKWRVRKKVSMWFRQEIGEATMAWYFSWDRHRWLFCLFASLHTNKIPKKIFVTIFFLIFLSPSSFCVLNAFISFLKP